MIKTLPAHLTHEMCSCGHMGGHSPNRNSHATRFQLGHGYCTVEGCSCNQFTWIGFCTKKGDIE